MHCDHPRVEAAVDKRDDRIVLYRMPMSSEL